MITARKYFYNKRRNLNLEILQSKTSLNKMENIGSAFFKFNNTNLDWVLSMHEDIEMQGVKSIKSASAMKSALENTLKYSIGVDKKAGFKDNAFLGEILLRNSPNSEQ